MPEHFAAAMHMAVAETLENMAFMEVVPTVKAINLDEDEMLMTSLLMHDPVQGEFRMVMPRGLLLRITEALFSLPVEEMTEQLATDTLLELLNTIAGQFLNAIFPGQVYKLGLPVVEKVGDVDMEATDTLWNYKIDEDGFSVSVTGASLMQMS